MKTVYKYIIPENKDLHYLKLPFGSTILYVREQHEEICLWAIVDTEEKFIENRVIRIAGTGHSLDDTDIYTYLGSAHLSGGNFIIHAFEVHYE